MAGYTHPSTRPQDAARAEAQKILAEARTEARKILAAAQRRQDEAEAALVKALKRNAEATAKALARRTAPDEIQTHKAEVERLTKELADLHAAIDAQTDQRVKKAHEITQAAEALHKAASKVHAEAKERAKAEIDAGRCRADLEIKKALEEAESIRKTSRFAGYAAGWLEGEKNAQRYKKGTRR